MKRIKITEIWIEMIYKKPRSMTVPTQIAAVEV